MIAQRHRILRYLTILSVVLFAAACTTIPIQGMSDARQAFQAAAEADASRLAADEYNEAKILLDDADYFMSQGRYDLAEKIALRAKVISLRARRKALQQSHHRSVTTP